jgi:hypothetical protein
MGNCVSDSTEQEFIVNKKLEKEVITFLSQNKLKIIGQTIDNARNFLLQNGYTVNTFTYTDTNKDILKQKRDTRRINLEVMNDKVINVFPSFL